MATLAPLNPNKVFADAHTLFERGQPPLIVLLACGSLGLIGVSHFLQMYHSTSSPVFLSNHVALPFSFRSIRRCLAHTSLRQSPPFTAFIPHRSHCTAPPRNSSARSGSLSVGCRPSCFGPDCLHLSLSSHRYAQQRLPLSLLPCVFRSLRRLPTLMLRVG